MHSFGGHILLRQSDGELLGPVVPEVEEDDRIVVLYRTYRLVPFVHRHNGFDELVGHAVVVGFKNARHQVGRFLTYPVYELVVSRPYTFPTFIPVHGIITAYHRGNFHVRAVNMALKRTDETLAAVRVGIASVHEAVNIRFRYAVSLRQVA